MFSKLFKSPIYLLVVLLILAANHTAFALEQSSKRDCVVCHIMWLDDFRTGEETLTDFQPGNVLMKDTQGVVSSEEICYSCHDGYVLDSRHITWKLNRHPVFVKPSENITVPEELPLSVKGEIYCGTCHSAHGQGATGDNPEGRTTLYREANIDSGLCERCHRDKASYKKSNSHPLHTDALELPDKIFRMGSTKARNKNMVICQSCHETHGALGEKLLITSNKNSELCILCHKEKESLIGTKHDLRTTLPDETNIKQQPLTESGPCGACHTPHKASGKKLWARPLEKGNPATQMCLTCHGDDTGYKIKGIGEFTHPINVPLTANERKSDKLPLFTEDGTKKSTGKVQCFTCHDIHKWDPNFPASKGGKNIEGDASNSFLRVASLSSDICLICHSPKQQVMTSDHNLTVTAPEEKNIQGFSPAVSGPCGVCHIPHNATAKRLWAKELSRDTDFISQLCTSCHKKNGAAKDKLLGDYYHPVDIPLEGFSIFKVYNITSTLPLYDAEGNVSTGGKLVCITCHEPHIWDPVNPVKDYSFKNVEGDARNSFLRKTNSPTSDLCKTCHKHKGFVDGTDHDLNITSPASKNLLGQTVSESGQCGACHLVHNSPNRMKLWARPYGRAAFKEDIVNSLCYSCHSKGKIGESKIPIISTHPEERLINNLMHADKYKIDYAPIYDKRTGDEINIGNISCPSCHNAHQWNPLFKVEGSYKNIEGTATNSFLRNVSYNNICIDCHGLDALFRYKYYHDPEERVETPASGIQIRQ